MKRRKYHDPAREAYKNQDESAGELAYEKRLVNGKRKKKLICGILSNQV
jgi:hypothetical protein